MNMKNALALVMGLLISSAALADCIIDNVKKVPEGTVIGTKQCQNGEWVKIKSK